MMENREIQKILPHRYPFLLIDRIPLLEPGKKAVGIKQLTVGEWFFQEHSLYPPSLILESLAQVGGVILGSKAREETPGVGFIGLFAGVSNFQWQRYPALGEEMTLKMELNKSLAGVYRFGGEVWIGQEKIGGGEILLSFIKNPAPGREP